MVKQKQDALGRRSRMHPQSSGDRLTLQPRDLLWLEKLNEHGPLPSSFLLAFCKDTHASEKRSKDRLTKLFNENNTPDHGSYLTRPAQQAHTLDSRYNQLVYDLTKSGRKALARERPEAAFPSTNTGHWVHKLMVACITASLDLACRDRDDVNYISGASILKRAEAELRCPVAIAYPSNPDPLTRDLIPDALFGLEYVGNNGSSYRFFAVEADRGTEPAVTGNWEKKSHLKNVLQYQAYIEGGVYRKHLGLTAPMMVLNVTNSQARMEKMLEVTASRFPAGNSYMLYQHWDDFGAVFKPPVPNSGLLDHDWLRAGICPLSIGSV